MFEGDCRGTCRGVLQVHPYGEWESNRCCRNMSRNLKLLENPPPLEADQWEKVLLCLAR